MIKQSCSLANFELRFIINLYGVISGINLHHQQVKTETTQEGEQANLCLIPGWI